MKNYPIITDIIGKTPLIKLQRMTKDLPATLLLKLEFCNPFGSVKDRIGQHMIETAEKMGLLKPGMSVIEPTSGNTGIALAFVCAAKGYPLTLVMPETMSMERRTLLLLLGAHVILTPGSLGMKGAIAKTKEILEQEPEWFYPSQFANPANPEVHRNTTAEEIWADTDGTVDVVVSGVGTGGTLTGVGGVLKGRKNSIKMIAVEPEESQVLAGHAPGPHKIQGIGAGFVPEILQKDLIDEIRNVASEKALATARQVIQEEGIPVGISSGAAISVGMDLAQSESFKDKVIVAIVPSYTERYLSTLLAERERIEASQLEVQSVHEKYLS